ncbi:MAG: CpaF family protein [Rhodospirillales bacterium]|nr:CpaF family protein [Rhodospirillales bacterium]MBT5075282.1 CpaF family protein [Rhodospirillales bacterium]MBT5113398.1 CpaF family protein [Rhodospirillales bacterium]MBT5672224.1 CpaF family protein [Rhodospirillales bacterium]MBT6187177.1 CpaF family protein [Rhodospirillales bacterium]
MAVEPGVAKADALAFTLKVVDINAGQKHEAENTAPDLEADAPVQSSPESEHLRSQVQAKLLQKVDVTILARLPRADIAREISTIVEEILAEISCDVDALEQRNLVTALVQNITGNETSEPSEPNDKALFAEAKAALSEGLGEGEKLPSSLAQTPIQNAKSDIQAALMERIDVTAASRLPRKELANQISDVVVEILGEMKIQLNLIEQRDLVSMLLNDMLGLGPLEPLLEDESITDIMVNGPDQVYVERSGKLELTDVHFRNNAHVMNIATRIVSRIGRRIDESQPLVDARLEDGSRVNIIAPPLAIDGASISIRKFAKQGITLERMATQGNMSEPLAKLLMIASRCRLNVLISGGTGSGKTTLLNALSHLVDNGERIVTIEDAAELQLQQPHVVRLETRPPNLEGSGEISMRDLLKNALRMRPDRIILGEIRGSEALDMLQAMNTGHDGSMSTVHANNPREALTRLENMVAMAGVNLPSQAVRTQIASAVHLIIQISRMRDGMRRIMSVAEVTGMEGDVITSQELFSYDFEGQDRDDKLIGSFKSSGIRPAFFERAEYYGLGRALMETVS